MPVRSNLVVADMAGEDNGAVYGSTIVLNRKQLSKEDGWARTLIHEVEHLTEGTKEWNELAHYLLASGNSDPAFDAVARNYFKGDETVGESALAKFQEGTAFTELTEQEQLFLTELIAHETEVLFGSERMLRRIAKEKRSLAKRLLERIEDFFRILKMSKEERKAFVKLEQARACLEKALLAAGSNAKAEQKTLRYSFDEYSDKQKENWKSSNRIVLYENDIQYSEFIKEARENNRYDKKIYFGMVSEELAKMIYNKTEIDVSGFNCSLSAYEIRKIFKDHGDEQKENLRGQRAVTEKDLLNIPRVIQDADEISESPKQYNEKPVINFIKELNGRFTVSAVVSNKRLDLFVQTAFIGIKKGDLSTPIDEQASINTPEASSGTISTDSIHQNGDSVKPDAKKSKADADFESSDAEDFFREAAARSVSEVVGESEKSTKSPEAPLAPKKRGLSEGQAKKLEANYVNHKTFSRKEVAEVVDSITRKHLDFGEDYGVLIGKGRQEAIDALFVYLNTPGADHQLRAGEKIADLILENAIVKNMLLHFQK